MALAYNVSPTTQCTMYEMKTYPVSKARERFADLLDEVDQNGGVIVERRKVEYVITVRPVRKDQKARRSAIQIVDPAVGNGQWRWTWTSEGIRFAGRRARP